MYSFIFARRGRTPYFHPFIGLINTQKSSRIRTRHRASYKRFCSSRRFEPSVLNYCGRILALSFFFCTYFCFSFVLLVKKRKMDDASDVNMRLFSSFLCFITFCTYKSTSCWGVWQRFFFSLLLSAHSYNGELLWCCFSHELRFSSFFFFLTLIVCVAM